VAEDSKGLVLYVYLYIPKYIIPKVNHPAVYNSLSGKSWRLETSIFPKTVYYHY